jgi:hypothetical protein
MRERVGSLQSRTHSGYSLNHDDDYVKLVEDVTPDDRDRAVRGPGEEQRAPRPTDCMPCEL